uniref:Ig-like domain-containing protein n=1 Tax=Parastrongyloides trichosuri TaxID=131310 RepID=A0A0N4Z006_PARTI
MATHYERINVYDNDNFRRRLNVSFEEYYLLPSDDAIVHEMTKDAVVKIPKNVKLIIKCSKNSDDSVYIDFFGTPINGKRFDCISSPACVIQITSTTQRDSGIYKCISTRKKMVKDVVTILLISDETIDKKAKEAHNSEIPFIFPVIPTTIKTSRRTVFDLPCVFDPYDISYDTKIEWYHSFNNEGEKIRIDVMDAYEKHSYSSGFSMLSIRNDKYSKEGLYTCNISNSKGYSVIEYKVVSPPMAPVVERFGGCIFFGTRSSSQIREIHAVIGDKNEELNAKKFIVERIDFTVLERINYNTFGVFCLEDIFGSLPYFGRNPYIKIAVKNEFFLSEYSQDIKFDSYVFQTREFHHFYKNVKKLADEVIEEYDINDYTFKENVSSEYLLFYLSCIILLLLKEYVIYGNVFMFKQENDNSRMDRRTVNAIHHLKKKLRIKNTDRKINVNSFMYVDISKNDFSERYFDSEKVRIHYEKHGIFPTDYENTFEFDNENKEVLISKTKIPYDGNNGILAYFRINRKIFNNTPLKGYFQLNLKNLEFYASNNFEHIIEIYLRNYNNSYEDKIIAVDDLIGYKYFVSNKRNIPISNEFLKEMWNEPYYNIIVYAKLSFKDYKNVEKTFEIKLPSVIKSFRLKFDGNNLRKKRSSIDICDPLKVGKSCCVSDEVINLNNITAFKNVFFPKVINIRKCVGSCVLRDSLYHSTYMLEKLTNGSIKKQSCCYPTQYEEIKITVGKTLSTAVEVLINDLVIKSCSCY